MKTNIFAKCFLTDSRAQFHLLHLKSSLSTISKVVWKLRFTAEFKMECISELKGLKYDLVINEAAVYLSNTWQLIQWYNGSL